MGATGEVAEYEAAQKLRLKLEIARTVGYDAYRRHGKSRETFQIKGRAVAAADKYRGRVPKIDCSKPFDAVLLVLLDRTSFEPIEVWRAERHAVKRRLSAPGSKARNERSQMGISQFKSVASARLIWSRSE